MTQNVTLRISSLNGSWSHSWVWGQQKAGTGLGRADDLVLNIIPFELSLRQTYGGV